MDAFTQAVLDAVEKAWPRQVAHLQALVRKPSTLAKRQRFSD